MIEGIEVLSTSEIYAVSNISLALAIFFLVAMVLSVIGASVFKKLRRVIMIIIAIICFCGAIYNSTNTKPTGKYEYKVTVNDNVSFNDFHNKYEIINIEEKIYTIKERE